MNSVGSLDVTAIYGEGRLCGLTVRLERPPVTKLFVGRPPAAVARLVPSLYTLCSRAQATAAQAALAAAAGLQAEPADSQALWAEALHEHLWRLLLDWPAALGVPQAKGAFIAWRAARMGSGLAGATLALLEDVLLGRPAEEWRQGGAVSPASLAACCLARLEGAENTRFFDPPVLTPSDWLAYWRGDEESEPATIFPPSVAAAWGSRVKETVDAALALATGAPYPVAAVGGGGWGIGQTLTARGMLTHGVRIEDGKVAAYRVWAPTDRHFADSAPLAELLNEGTWPDVDSARRAVEQAVLALDPCLPYTVKVDNA